MFCIDLMYCVKLYLLKFMFKLWLTAGYSEWLSAYEKFTRHSRWLSLPFCPSHTNYLDSNCNHQGHPDHSPNHNADHNYNHYHDPYNSSNHDPDPNHYYNHNHN